MTDITVKHAYTYFDDNNTLYNLFVFIELCSVGFCVHRARKDFNDLIDTENTTFEVPGDIVYIYKNQNIMSKSIKILQKKFPTMEKITIDATTLENIKTSLSCMSCYSCNNFIYMLTCAYTSNPTNVLENGIYAKYSKKNSNDDVEYLEKCLENEKELIIKKPIDLFDKIFRLIANNYDSCIFYKISKLVYVHLHCNYKKHCDDFCYVIGGHQLFFCLNCLINTEKSYYTLCDFHYTEENIKLHSNTCHNNSEIKFLHGTNDIKKLEPYFPEYLFE